MIKESRGGIIINDSADLLKNEVLKKDFHVKGERMLVVPIRVIFGNNTYETEVGLNTEKFRKLTKTTEIMSTTSLSNKEANCYESGRKK